MGTTPTGLNGLLGVALSGGVHLAVAFMVPRVPASVPFVPPRASEVELRTLPPEPEPSPVPPQVHVAPEPPPAPARPRRRSPQPREAPAHPETTPPEPPPTVEAPAPLTSPVVRPARPGLELSPAAVARAGYMPSTPGPVAPSRPTTSTDEGSREAAERRLNAHLALANDAPAEGLRPPPRLLRRSDGGFLWRGPGFRARIARDGEVTFSDRPGFEFDGDNSGASALPSLSFRFDITDALERRQGHDPYYADRRWFMGQTEELREELAARAQTERGAHDDRRLLGQLRRLAQDDSRTLSARHRAIYRIWRDCAEDEVGRRARARVLRFVREELPESGPDAFSLEELRELNLAGGAAFRPYVSP